MTDKEKLSMLYRSSTTGAQVVVVMKFFSTLSLIKNVKRKQHSLVRYFMPNLILWNFPYLGKHTLSLICSIPILIILYNVRNTL